MREDCGYSGRKKLQCMGTNINKKWLISLFLLAAFVVISLLFITAPHKEPRSELHASDLKQVVTQDGNLTRYDYVDEDGNPQIAANVGYATRLVFREDNRELETYLDDRGERISRYSGYYGILREYDDDGHDIRITYLDEENNPFVIALWYAVEERTFNESGQVESCRYLDAEGKPTLSRYYGYGARYEYDEKGRRNKIIYFDEMGKPMIISSGYSSLMREYYETDGPENGKVKREFYFLEDGTPATLSLGQCGVYKEYNTKNGQNSLITYLDAAGNPIVTNKGYTSVAYTYHANNTVESTLYYDINGNPYRLNEGQYGTQNNYGEMLYLNADGSVQFSIKNFVYNNSGFIVLIALVIVLPTAFSGTKTSWLLLIGYIGAIAFFTLMYREVGESEISVLDSYRRIFVSAEARADILKNIWLFIPLGAILYRLYPQKTVLILPLLLSITIELTQYLAGLGLCELDDVISNGLGGVIGYAICPYRFVRRHITSC